MPTHEVVAVRPQDIMRLAGLEVDLPIYGRAIVEGGKLLAVYGLAWSTEPKRCWLFFHVENYRPGYGMTVRREARRCFRVAAQLGETEIYTVRDRDYPSSLKLMHIFGFEPFAVENDQEVWIWHSSRQSQQQ